MKHYGSLANGMLNELSSDIAYKIGQIQGTARRIKILKSMSRKEIDAALDSIYKWGEEINQINKDLANKITERSSD